MFRAGKILLCIFASYVDVTFSAGQECSPERLRKCRHVVLEELERRSTGLNSQELDLHCKSIRQNVDCLVWQLTDCAVFEGADKNGDAIYKGWKYLQNICDSLGGWWQKRCFQRDDSKQCERHYGGGASNSLRGSCIEYDRFRDCISDVVKRRCEPEDSNVLGTFLLDKAGEMVWKCPAQIQVSDSAFGASSAYSSAILADSPYGSVNSKFSNQGCNARATEEMRGCLDRYQYEWDQSLGSREGDDRFRRLCCAKWNYRRCVQNAVRTHCYDSRYDSREIEVATDIIGYDKDLHCREHWVYTCSGATRISGVPTLQVIMIVLFAGCIKKYMLH